MHNVISVLTLLLSLLSLEFLR